ncbi:MAG: hypothetical protein ABIH65_00985 [Nanoarchaeota archaeon]
MVDENLVLEKHNLVLEKLLKRLEKIESKDWKKDYCAGEHLTTIIETNEGPIKIELYYLGKLCTLNIYEHASNGKNSFICGFGNEYDSEKIKSFYGALYPQLERIEQEEKIKRAKSDRLNMEKRLERLEKILDE